MQAYEIRETVSTHRELGHRTA